jgi:hypothetical protein
MRALFFYPAVTVLVVVTAAAHMIGPFGRAVGEYEGPEYEESQQAAYYDAIEGWLFLPTLIGFVVLVVVLAVAARRVAPRNRLLGWILALAAIAAAVLPRIIATNLSTGG